MKLFKLAAIATIVGTIIAFLQFVHMPSENKEQKSVEKNIEREKENIKLSLDLDIYKGERNWLLEMYKAAVAMPYSSSKSDALQRVVKKALENEDYNMAIIAAKKSPYSSSKADMLNHIVSSAINRKDTIGYAVLAAYEMPYQSSKNDALSRIILAYENFMKQPLDKTQLK